MILIAQGQTNTVVVTLTEKSTLDSPKYLFEFINQESKVKKYCIASDTSGYTGRYNKFSITEKSSPNNLNGEVTLSLTGYWYYNIYEQSSSTNLDPDLSTGLVETGKCKVTGTAQEDTTYEPVETSVVYNG